MKILKELSWFILAIATLDIETITYTIPPINPPAIPPFLGK